MPQEELDGFNGRFDEKQGELYNSTLFYLYLTKCPGRAVWPVLFYYWLAAQDKELEKLRIEVERAKQEAISHKEAAGQSDAEMDALKTVNKQYATRVVEV